MKARTILALAILATIAGSILLALFSRFGWSAVWFVAGAAAIWWALEALREAITQRYGLRIRLLQFVESFAETSLELHCDAPPIGRYEIFRPLAGGFRCKLRDKYNTSEFIADCPTREGAVNAARSDFERRMMEGLDDE